MTKKKSDLDRRIRRAVRHFWQTRLQQGKSQGNKTGRRDYGNRKQATGGKQMDGFARMIRDELVAEGIPSEIIFDGSRVDVTLPGFYRPTKQWDVLVVADGNLLGAIELKALCGPSFGNNYNNRIEEAIGIATDLWTAYREGLFATSPKPFLGFVMMLEDATGSGNPVAVTERHFPADAPFRGTSCADRCQETLRRLVRERQYDAALFLMSSARTGLRGSYDEPSADLSAHRFATLMRTHIAGSADAIAQA